MPWKLVQPEETPSEQQARLRSMSEDDGDTWDLSDNDKAACKAGADALARVAALHALVDVWRRTEASLLEGAEARPFSPESCRLKGQRETYATCAEQLAAALGVSRDSPGGTR